MKHWKLCQGFEMSSVTGEGEMLTTLSIPLALDCILSDSTDKGIKLFVLLSTHVTSLRIFCM
jgi:hypothetical protein